MPIGNTRMRSECLHTVPWFRVSPTVEPDVQWSSRHTMDDQSFSFSSFPISWSLICNSASLWTVQPLLI